MRTNGPRHSYPHTIDNGAGERITFLRRVPGAADRRSTQRPTLRLA